MAVATEERDSIHPDQATALVSPSPETDEASAARLIAALLGIRTSMLALETRFAAHVAALPAARQASARNLLHYLAFRQFDIRTLQDDLAMLGLSSLGRAEAHVLASLDRVLAMLHRIVGRPWHPEPPAATGFREGERLLAERTDGLLGAAQHPRTVRIMVTMPSEAAGNGALVREMLEAGMDCMRINCAHDGPEAWAAMVRNLRDAEQALGRRCTVLMDLGGPKLRTGPVSGPEVIKCRPRRDAWGRVVVPARVWLTAGEMSGAPPEAADVTIPVPHDFLARIEAGDRITFGDTRGARRAFSITAVEADGCWAETAKTCYIGSHMPVRLKKAHGESHEARVGTLASVNPALLLKIGDTLHLTRAMRPGRAATIGDDGTPATPATIACTLPEIFDDVRPGERVWFDDGKIGGVIRAVHSDRLDIEITHARPAGSRLRADKGINLPDSDLRLPALTEKDLQDLDTLCTLADMVGLSFVRTADDVAQLQRLLMERGASRLGIVLKLETRSAFAQLPHLLLQAMHTDATGVMIARGDLAVESGFERLAEVQEEILWVCEAAHLPAIWATQVLETLAATGLSTRAEITDAAMGERAECVMLNKGPYIVAAIHALDDILRRMQSHRRKRIALMRQLHAWSASLSEGDTLHHDG